jgi:hypothetical protein
MSFESEHENLKLGKMVYIPSHSFGVTSIEVKEYRVIHKNEQQAKLKHTGTLVFPGNDRQPGSDSVLLIEKHQFDQFNLPLTKKMEVMIDTINMVCDSARALNDTNSPQD